MKVVIIGGGIIGAALAHNLLRAGADVTVIAVGIGATGASFGWINASFYLDAAHFRLRAAGLEAWRRLDLPVNWSGALCWERRVKVLKCCWTPSAWSVWEWRCRR